MTDLARLKRILAAKDLTGYRIFPVGEDGRVVFQVFLGHSSAAGLIPSGGCILRAVQDALKKLNKQG